MTWAITHTWLRQFALCFALHGTRIMEAAPFYFCGLLVPDLPASVHRQPIRRACEAKKPLLATINLQQTCRPSKGT